MHLALEFGDRAGEAQAQYSLGTTYTLVKDYPKAVEYHLRHLTIAQDLLDKFGEGRACWSLGNAYAAMGQYQKAYCYAAKHLQISNDTGDRTGQATAQLNLAEHSKKLCYPEEAPLQQPATASQNEARNTSGSAHNNQGRRKSIEEMAVGSASLEINSAGAAQLGLFKQQKDELLGNYRFSHGTKLIERKF